MSRRHTVRAHLAPVQISTSAIESSAARARGSRPAPFGDLLPDDVSGFGQGPRSEAGRVEAVLALQSVDRRQDRNREHVECGEVAQLLLKRRDHFIRNGVKFPPASRYSLSQRRMKPTA
jgi:hypothetical protein